MTEIVLESSKLGDPIYERADEVNRSHLTFYGDAADYVTEVLSAARSKRVITELVERYAEYLVDKEVSLAYLKAHHREFARALLESSAGLS